MQYAALQTLVWLFKKAFLSVSCFTCKSSLAGGDIPNRITVQTEKEQKNQSISKQPVGPAKITPKVETTQID